MATISPSDRKALDALNESAQLIAIQIRNTDAGRLLIDPHCSVWSYTGSTDYLESLGLETYDGERTELGLEVKAVLETLMDAGYHKQ